MSRLPSFLAALVLAVIPARSASGAPLRREVLLESAEAHYTLLELDEAARDWEVFARMNPRDTRAPELHARAAHLRVLLGQEREAAIDVVDLQRMWGRKHPALVARAMLEQARSRADRGALDEASTLLSRALTLLTSTTLVETRVEVQSLLGRTFAAQGRTVDAVEAHRRVVALARQKDAQVKGGATAWGEPARDAVAESRFFFAEQVRSRAEAVKLAPYRGPADRETVIKYIINEASPWMLRRREANEEAMRAYQSVLGIEVPPPQRPRAPAGGDPNAPLTWWGTDDSLGPDVGSPPSIRWAIAAAERVGSLWGDYVHTFRALPVPREWRAAQEINATYYMRLDPVDEPFKMSAKRAYEYCVRLSRSNGIFDEHTRSCEDWLSRNYSGEYSGYDEIFPTPKWAPPAVISAPMKYDR